MNGLWRIVYDMAWDRHVSDMHPARCDFSRNAVCKCRVTAQETRSNCLGKDYSNGTNKEDLVLN